MYGLAHVLVPRAFTSLQSELDRTLAPFKRGGEDAFPRDKLAFDDATDRLARLHRAKFRLNIDGSLTWLDGDATPSLDLRLTRLAEHLAACRLDTFEGMFAEIEPDFDAFVRRFTDYQRRAPETGRYGRWLNPIGYWDWWELGGRFNGVITDDRRPAGAEQVISSGPSSGRAMLGNIVEAFGTRPRQDEAAIEANVELVETLKLAGDRDRDGGCLAVRLLCRRGSLVRSHRLARDQAGNTDCPWRPGRCGFPTPRAGRLRAVLAAGGSRRGLSFLILGLRFA